jgi:hypothetical protein
MISREIGVALYASMQNIPRLCGSFNVTPIEAVLRIVDQHERGGGITAKDVVVEVYRGQNYLPEDEMTIYDAVWDLLRQDRIRLSHDRRLRLPIHGEVKAAKVGRGPSGILPIGPGDTLYNVDGEPVAMVKDIDVNEDGSLDLLALPTFTRLSSGRSGTEMINSEGKIIGPARARQCDLDHDKLQDELRSKNITGSCPDCDTYLYTASNAWKPTQDPTRRMNRWPYT